MIVYCSIDSGARGSTEMQKGRKVNTIMCYVNEMYWVVKKW